ncbi:MAG: cytochrome c biogenesis protein CcsA [Prolixibacteraceae bacterium]
MKRFFSFITSMPFMAFLLLVLAFAMAIATFVESSYGTPAARSLIYNRFWFELLWILLAVNLVNNLIRYRLLSKRRFTMGLFHISFLVILLGAGITRYFSYEGMMHIRENQSSDFILSSTDYFYAGVGDQEKEKQVQFSELTPRQFSASFDVNGKDVKVRSVGFISDAGRKPIPAESGEAVIDFVFSSTMEEGMQAYNFLEGSVLEVPGFSAGFESEAETDVTLFIQGDSLYLTSNEEIGETTMASQQTETFEPGDTIPVKPMFMYSFDEFRFLIRTWFPSAKFTAIKSPQETGEDAVIIEVTDGVRQQTLPVFGHTSVIPDTVEVPLGNQTLKLAYGAQPIEIPFRLYLEDFQLERYPGSDSPSSFASEVVLIDEDEGVEREVRIFMNNTLLYKGYKFFQSSYDQDEKGTVLSVNHDLWGTWITYLGYALLIIGIFLSLANPNSYFMFLAGKLKRSNIKAVVLIMLSGGIALSTSAQPGDASNLPKIDKELVKQFDQLWVQGPDGRIEPVSTLTSEIVRKISRKSSLYGMSPSEVVLSMMTYSEMWRNLPVIRISDKVLNSELGVSGKYVTLRQLFDEQGNYKIASQVQAAFAKSPGFRNQVDKEYINLDERINISFMIYQGSLLQLFPRNEKEDPWYAPGEVAEEYSGGDSVFVKSGFNLLVQSIAQGQNDRAMQILQAVESFQLKNGSELLPSERKKEMEMLYNKINPFERIYPWYILFGLMLIILLIINIFRQKPLPRFLRISFLIIILLLFVVHTAGLALRWYISGHAPWSNGYESVIYVAWATMLAGVIFGRKYPMVIGTASFLTGIALFVAHLNWMSPEITNLVPVLKSYWLTIHVSIITSSYGFFGLSMILGVVVLILMVLRNKSNQHKVTLFIDQLTTVNEMSATVGLYFLTIGTFLGGVWANESWGRYWGWDPKETWALITVMLYSFIVHMRLIPSLKGLFNYTVASVFGFASVLMTYFGVNYFLAGLHSYGKGAADGVHPAVPISFGLLFALMIWAYFKDVKYEKENPALLSE